MNPFLLEDRSLISFSGGRTSGRMLHDCLAAHGGQLPAGVEIAFTNTGKERPETLRFVHECASRWGARVRWLEWRATPAQVEARPTFRAWLDRKPERWAMVDPAGFAEVGFNSACRAGEPFAALIAMKQYTPNAVTRFCTQELKVRVMRDFCRSLGWESWTNIVGLRHDEGSRVLKALDRNASNKEVFKVSMPLAKARLIERDVLDFWWGEGKSFASRAFPQGFDLDLRSYEGNCDLCFLKAKARVVNLITENPGMEEWWIEMETLGKGRFVTERSYAELADMARRQGYFDFGAGEEEHDVECGLLCEPLE